MDLCVWWVELRNRVSIYSNTQDCVYLKKHLNLINFYKYFCSWEITMVLSDQIPFPFIPCPGFLGAPWVLCCDTWRSKPSPFPLKFKLIPNVKLCSFYCSYPSYAFIIT